MSAGLAIIGMTRFISMTAGATTELTATGITTNGENMTAAGTTETFVRQEHIARWNSDGAKCLRQKGRIFV